MAAWDKDHRHLSGGLNTDWGERRIGRRNLRIYIHAKPAHVTAGRVTSQNANSKNLLIDNVPFLDHLTVGESCPDNRLWRSSLIALSIKES